MSEHTPLPWEYDGNYEVIAQKNAYESICVLNVTPRSGANAAFIVKAVNSHAALVEALTELSGWVNRVLIPDRYADPKRRPVPENLAVALEKARAALALAGETS